MTRKVLASLLSLALAVTLVPAVGLVHPEKAEAATSKRISFNSGLINSVGRQSTSGHYSCCATYSCAYGDSIITGSAKNHSSYNTKSNCKSNPSCGWNGWKVSKSFSDVFNDLNANKPCIIHVVNSNGWGTKGNQHWVLAIGYKDVSNSGSLSMSNLIVLDPWDGKEITASQRYSRHSDNRVYRTTKSVTPPTPTAVKPSISFTDIFGGKSATIGSSTSSSTIRYTTNGQSPTANSGATLANWGSFVMSATASVKALATRSGYNPSGVSERWSGTIGTVKTPTISESYSEDGIMVSISADSGAKIFYTTDGTTPTFDTAGRCTRGTEYKTAFLVTKDCTVNAVAGKSGMRNSTKASKSISCTAPAAPTVKLSASHIAKGDAVQVTWNGVSNTVSYVVTLIKDGKEVKSEDTKGTVASFVLDEDGTYSVSVAAKNAFGTSKGGTEASVEAMDDCVVRFVDTVENDAGGTVTKVFDRQDVRWGYDATTPTSPSKRGYTFDGWSGSYSKVTEDVDVHVKWKINKYKVRFYKEDGSTLIGSAQTVEFNKPAAAPTTDAVASARTGYEFTGWSVMDAADDSERDISRIDSDMKLRAVYSWKDKELPVVAQITDANRDAAGNYNVTVKLTNSPDAVTTALLRVALKTSAGKLVQTSRETFEVPADDTVSRTVTLKYSGDYVATVAEAEVVGIDGNYRTGGAYSEAVTSSIRNLSDFSYSEWSDWQVAELTADDESQVESTTQYRYRDKADHRIHRDFN